MKADRIVWQLDPALRRILRWAVPLVALSMLTLMLIPSRVWHRPTNFELYRGFDPNLIYVRNGNDPHAGGIWRIAPDIVTLTATPGSQPSAYLLTTKMNYKAAMDIRIHANARGIPLQIGIWSPRKDIGYYLKFGPPPRNLVTSEIATRGEVGKTQPLGSYEVGQTYHLEIAYDKQKGTIENHLSGKERPPTGSNMLLLTGGPSSPTYREVRSQSVPVNGGGVYAFGGNVKLAFGQGDYKLSLVWLNRERNRVGQALGWRPPTELKGWTMKSFSAQAPQKAAFALLILGADDRTQYFMSDLFIRPPGPRGRNLLTNSDFTRGPEGWNQVAPPNLAPRERPTIVRPSQHPMDASVSAKEVPDLFLYLPASLIVTSSSSEGLNEVLLTDYALSVPAQDWFATRVDDPRLARLLLFLIVAGAMLCIASIRIWVKDVLGHSLTSWRTACLGWLDAPVMVRPWLVGTVAGAVVVYLVGNALLFNLGYHPQDFISEKIFAYVATRYGPAHVFFLPALMSPADQWGGVPYSEALFPYQPIMAYFFTLVGWMYRRFFADPGILRVDTFQLGFAIKSLTVLFGLASAILIYLIVRPVVSQRVSLLTSSLFLFNPALWFVTSIWGQTYTVPIFLLLASIWLTLRYRPHGAWLALGLTALTRSQILVPAFLLGLVLLRRFSLKQNLYAISWAIIAIFMILAPLSAALSPSLPFDVQRQLMHELNPEKEIGEYYGISLGANNIWPLVSGVRDGLKGPERWHVPSTAPLAGSFAYLDVGNILFVGAFAILAAAVLLRKGVVRVGTDFLPVIAAGQMAVLMLRTGIASTHFVLLLPLVALSRASLSGFAYYASFTILTLSTLISAYGDLGSALWQVGYLAPAIHHSYNPVTKFVMDLSFADQSITIGALGNTAVLVWLGTKALRRTST